jgi:GNAT superfamily N-acetyltransferase
MEAWTRNGYRISTDPTRLNRTLVHRFLSEQSVWARDIPAEVVDRAIEHSLCFGVYCGGEQVGFARVITDHATFAYLNDLFILEAHRRHGLATWLVQTVLVHPHVRGLKSWWLLTGSVEARRLFEEVGFHTPEPERLTRWMTLPGGGRGFYQRSHEGGAEPTPELETGT